MTPKEKAKELVDKYTEVVYPILNIGKAKQCALIAVNSMLEEFSKHQNVIAWKEYMEVKQEIEKL